jgi:hypothetical protein
MLTGELAIRLANRLDVGVPRHAEEFVEVPALRHGMVTKLGAIAAP